MFSSNLLVRFPLSGLTWSSVERYSISVASTLLDSILLVFFRTCIVDETPEEMGQYSFM